jgi:hypothetical protein
MLEECRLEASGRRVDSDWFLGHIHRTQGARVVSLMCWCEAGGGCGKGREVGRGVKVGRKEKREAGRERDKCGRR